MVEVFIILFPLFFILGLGFFLARIDFLNSTGVKAFNGLVYYVALPSVIIFKVSHAEIAGESALRMLGAFQGGTLLLLGLTFWVSGRLGHRDVKRTTFVQGAFRANLAFIGLPVLIYALEHLAPEVRDQYIASAVLVFAPTMITYNLFSVLLFLAGRGELNWRQFGKSTRTVLSNPLIVSGLVGIFMALLGWTLPEPLDLSLEALGRIAVPLALLCIGASLATVEMHGRRRGVLIASALKLAVLPFFVWLMSWVMGLNGPETFTVMIYAACPTAAASYVLCQQMGGDEGLASGVIALSTVFSVIPLAVVLWIFGV